MIAASKSCTLSPIRNPAIRSMMPFFIRCPETTATSYMHHHLQRDGAAHQRAAATAAAVAAAAAADDPLYFFPVAKSPGSEQRTLPDTATAIVHRVIHRAASRIQTAYRRRRAARAGAAELRRVRFAAAAEVVAVHRCGLLLRRRCPPGRESATVDGHPHRAPNPARTAAHHHRSRRAVHTAAPAPAPAPAAGAAVAERQRRLNLQPAGEPAPYPHARELLTPRDAMLQFKFPLSLPGVKQLIIWGDEGSNATREADLKTWLATNADAFDGSRPDSLLKNVDGQGRGAAGQTTQRPAASAGNAAARPPAASVPRDGPIPPYTVCSLWT